MGAEFVRGRVCQGPSLSEAEFVRGRYVQKPLRRYSYLMLQKHMNVSINGDKNIYSCNWPIYVSLHVQFL